MDNGIKSIGNLRQYNVNSDNNDEETDESNEKNYEDILTCNGYSNSYQPGNKLNVLLCSACDLRNRKCGIQPQKPNALTKRYVKERFQHSYVSIRMIHLDAQFQLSKKYNIIIRI